MSNHHIHHQLTQGFSLLEMLLASALAVVLIATLTNLYINLNHTLRRNQQVITDSLVAARLLTIFKSEIQSAGHIGCAELTSDFVVLPYQQHTLSKANSLQVTANELAVQYQSMPTASVLAINERKNVMTTDMTLSKNAILVISDCAHAEVNKVKSVNEKNGVTKIGLQQPVHFAYARNAEAGHLMRHRYYLRQSGNHSDLMMEDSSGNHNLIQPNVTDLQFESDSHGVTYTFELNHTVWSGYARTA